MTSPRVLVVAFVLTTLAVLVGLVAGGPPEVGGVPPHVSIEAPDTRAERPRPEEVRALAVLHRWDVRRARAWARADPTALVRLYAPGSLTGRRDVAMLRRWRSRGLRVRGLRMQVLTARVRLLSRDRVVLVVTDRVVGANAVGSAGATPLPRDRASRHVIALVLRQGEWRVSEVRDQARPARRTARTPASRNS